MQKYFHGLGIGPKLLSTIRLSLNSNDQFSISCGDAGAQRRKRGANGGANSDLTPRVTRVTSWQRDKTYPDLGIDPTSGLE